VDYFAAEVPHLQQGSAIDDGDGVDMGAMISGQRFSHLEGLIQDAVKQGANLLHGGRRYDHPKHTRGFFFQPTLLVDVTKSMAIANEELFAPVALLMKVETIDEAIEIANSTIYGLGGSVFGSRKADVEKVLREVETVGLAVNDFATFYVCQLPFGGTKGSGYGRFMGVEGLRGLCNQKVRPFNGRPHTKSICLDTFPSVARTAIPPVVDYPITNPAKSWKFVTGLMYLAYGLSLGEVLGGLYQVLTSLGKKTYRK
jgi:acyl-CoA reductase-like NAD-dependent aldehyde dehydrogenase